MNICRSIHITLCMYNCWSIYHFKIDGMHCLITAGAYHLMNICRSISPYNCLSISPYDCRSLSPYKCRLRTFICWSIPPTHQTLQYCPFHSVLLLKLFKTADFFKKSELKNFFDFFIFEYLGNHSRYLKKSKSSEFVGF